MSRASANLLAPTFIVEGNIGAGKSTFLAIIKANFNAQVVYEPLDRWQHIGGSENLLEKFYTDITRWGYTFQSYAFVSRLMVQEEHAHKNPHPVQILERSVFSDRYAFAKNCFELGGMTSLEWRLYQEWFSWLVERHVTQPTGFIYLRTDPAVCFERLTGRGRAEESAVSMDYLIQIHQKHDLWLIEKESIAPMLQDVPILILDCDKDFVGCKQEQKKHIEAVAEFIYQQSTLHALSGIQARL